MPLAGVVSTEGIATRPPETPRHRKRPEGPGHARQGHAARARHRWYGECCAGRSAEPVSERGSPTSGRTSLVSLVNHRHRDHTPRGTTTMTTTKTIQSLTNAPMLLVSLVNHQLGAYPDDDTGKDASAHNGQTLDAVPSASGLPRPIVRSSGLSMCGGSASETFLTDMVRTGIPSEPLQANVHRANSRIRVVSRCQSGHCMIVPRVGSDLGMAGCVRLPASEIFFGDSCPTYFGCTLSLMSAERISEGLRPLFLETSGSGMGQIPQPFS